MNKEIVITPDQIKALEIISDYAFSSKHFEKLGGKPAIFCILMFAQELGLNPMTCLFGGMRSIQGNIEISPRMMNAMIRKAGHTLNILKQTEEVCEIEGIRSEGGKPCTVSYSIHDARRAGLVRSGGGWEKFPSDMLFARCLSRIARRLFADVISTAYVEGEIERQEDAGTGSQFIPMANPEPGVGEAAIVEPEQAKDHLSIEEFVAKMNALVPGAHIVHDIPLEEYLNYKCTQAKNGKVVPIHRVMEQALRIPDKFVSSFHEWLKVQAEMEQVPEGDQTKAIEQV